MGKIILFIILGCGGVCSGCGQSGSLYLPKQDIIRSDVTSN